MPLFEKKNFISHSGFPLKWKLECDALTEEDWECLAFMISQRYSFYKVVGVPRGGIKLAGKLQQYADTANGTYFLIVDDVLTSGNSIIEYKNKLRIPPEEQLVVRGIVVFDRTGGPHYNLPWWVSCMFTYW